MVTRPEYDEARMARSFEPDWTRTETAPEDAWLASKTVLREPSAEDLDPVGVRRRRRRLERALAIVVPFVVLGLWQLFSELRWVDPEYFPPPTAVFRTGVTLVRNGTLLSDTWITMRRTLLGFALGVVTGFVVGIALSLSRLVRAALEPLVYALWTVPKLALLPLLLLIFGLGEKPIVVLIAINCFFLVLIATLASMLAVPFEWREVAQAFQASRWQMLRHVTIPAALPQIFVTMRITAGAAILTVVAAEFVESSSGLGYLIWNSWQLLLADQMYVGIIVVAILGTLFTMAVVAIGHKLTPWTQEG